MGRVKDVWDFLRIEPTRDKKAIRKAFAAQSRLHHPEEEPEYFVQLNQAYKEALAYAAGTEESEGFPAGHGYGADTAKAGSRVETAGSAKGGQESEGGGSAEAASSAKGGQESESGGSTETAKADGESDALRSEGYSGEDNGSGTADNTVSLLDMLQAAEKQAIEESIQKGALRDFKALFENPKQAKQADTWKRFFLSEAFLGEQFSEEFGKGLWAYLSRQTICPYDNLPMGFLQELAIAYAFIPHFAGEEYFDGLKYPKEWYKVSVENTFPARKQIAEIFNMQGRECDLKSMTGHILRQPANKVRHNAFSDYLEMKEMSRNGQLTEGEREKWEGILGLCQVYYLYERNGKSMGGAYESRSECVVKLYVQWLKDEQLPEEVLKFFYKKLAFRELDRSSTRGLYGALKEQVLRQLPQAEEILFGEDGEEQMATKLYRVYSAIINDNQTNYDRFIYGETPAIKERAKAFFALPEWEKLKNSRILFKKIYDTSKRLVMPRTITMRLIEHLTAGDFPEPERTELTESLLRSLATERMCMELDYRCQPPLCGTEKDGIGSSADFWQYYLMRGFGYRHTKVRGEWEEGFIYEMGGQCYLPAYINYICGPSRAWQKRFVGFDEEEEAISVPVSAGCLMPDGRKLRAEFHYHYCLYFVEDVQVIYPVLSFPELQEYAEHLTKPEEFFFLLAVTAVEDKDRGAAEELIKGWLAKIPLHSFIVPRVARMLAADNDRIPEDMTRQETWDMHKEIRNAGQETEETWRGIADGQQAGRAEAVFYAEQERFCFRALVWKNGVKVFRQADYGWQDIIFRRAELGWREFALPDELQKRMAGGLLEETGAQCLLEPKPVCRASCILEGMDMVQKTAKILEIMGGFENAEGYCVLRYGEKKEKRHDRVFYYAKAPFGFDLKAQSSDYVRSMNFLMASSNTKIKEPKVLLGRFGWGFKYSPRSDYGPMFVYLGESGRYYAYGAIRMHRADSLTELLADFFRQEFEGVTEAQAYEGCLTVSRLDHRLEYCYTEEDMHCSLHSLEDTAADGFTMFGGYGMWVEFARWMDTVLGMGLPEWVSAIIIGFDQENGGRLSFAGIYEEEEPDYDEEDLDYDQEGSDYDEEESEDDGEGADSHGGESDQGGPAEGKAGAESHEPYLPQVPLLVWAKGIEPQDRGQLLVNAVQWYMDCGQYAGALKRKGIHILVNRWGWVQEAIW